MALNSPGAILKLWLKVVKKHEDGKKPAELPRKGQEQKLKIKNGLTALKGEAPTARSNPEPFLARRDKTAVLLRKYCRHLKASRDEDKKTLPRYLKMVMALAVAVQDLDPGNLDLSETDQGLEALDAVKTDALEEALKQPDSDADVAEAPLPQDTTGGKADTPTEDEVPSGAAVVKRLLALNAEYTAAIAKPGPHVTILQTQYQKVRDAIDGKDFATADKAINGLQLLLGRARELAAKVPEATAALKAWQIARAQAINDLRKVSTAIAKSRDPEAGRMVVILESVVKNLPLNPSGPQAIAELATYLQTDDVIPAAEQAPSWYGGPLKVRQPLLDAVRQLQQGATASR